MGDVEVYEFEAFGFSLTGHKVKWYPSKARLEVGVVEDIVPIRNVVLSRLEFNNVVPDPQCVHAERMEVIFRSDGDGYARLLCHDRMAAKVFAERLRDAFSKRSRDGEPATLRAEVMLNGLLGRMEGILAMQAALRREEEVVLNEAKDLIEERLAEVLGDAYRTKTTGTKRGAARRSVIKKIADAADSDPN